LIKTGRSPIKALTAFPQSKIWVPHISLVFGEMWDSTALPPKIFPAKCAYPTLRIKAEDEEPDLCVSGMGCFFSESRMQIIRATNPTGKRISLLVSKAPGRNREEPLDPRTRSESA
jgi:hypothetical protein